VLASRCRQRDNESSERDVLSKEEGGRHTRFSIGYGRSLPLHDDVKGSVPLKAGTSG